MPATPSQASIRIVKQIPYRGGTRNFSNRYFFGSLTSLTSTTFNNLADALIAAEKLFFTSWVGYVEAIGYNGGTVGAAFSKSVSGSGSRTHTSEVLVPGDCCAIARFSTTARTSKGHPIYLFKYYHGVYNDGGSLPDTLSASGYSHLQTLADTLVSGVSDGTTARPISGPYGATAVAKTVDPYIGHRDFPR